MQPCHQAAIAMGGFALGLFLATPAWAQALTPGTTVEASPIELDGYWQTCTVVGGPFANNYYDLTCGATSQRVSQRWIRAAKVAPPPAAPPPAAPPRQPPAARPPVAPPPAPAAPPQGGPPPGVLTAGTRVEASPTQLNQFWKDCTVLRGPLANDYFELDCGDAFPDRVPRSFIRNPRPGPPLAVPQPAPGMQDPPPPPGPMPGQLEEPAMPIPKADLPPDGRPLPPPPPQVRQPPYDPNTPDIPNTTWKPGQFVLANGTGLVNGDWYSCTVNGPLPNNYVNLTCIIPHGTAQPGGWTYAVQEMHVPAKQIRPRQ